MNDKNNSNVVSKQIHFAFWGTSEFSVRILEELQKNNLTPTLIVTTPDSKKGRNLLLTPPPVKIWAEKENIPCIQPERLQDEVLVNTLDEKNFTFFVVASYGKILPKSILDLPKKGTLNVHPSLLPRLRGPSPIETAILTEKVTGVTIMQMDEEMDHGPILSQKKIDIPHFPLPASELGDVLAKEGGELLSKTIHSWLCDEITPNAQDHTKATYTEKLTKADAQIDQSESSEYNYRKILAYERFNPFFFTTINGNKKRVIIKKAHLERGELFFDQILPEGRKLMTYREFTRWTKGE